MAENTAWRTHLSFSGPALLQQAIEVSFDTNCVETATGEDKETTKGPTTRFPFRNPEFNPENVNTFHWNISFLCKAEASTAMIMKTTVSVVPSISTPNLETGDAAVAAAGA